MFRLTMFVEDKHLIKVLHDLTGRALDLQVVPVTNAVPASDGVKVKARHIDNSVAVAEAIVQSGWNTIDASSMRAILRKLGLSPGSRGHYFKKLRATGLLSDPVGPKKFATYAINRRTP